MVENVWNSLSVSQSLISDKIDKIKHYTRWKTYNPVTFKFWITSGIKYFIYVRLMKSQSFNDYNPYDKI